MDSSRYFEMEDDSGESINPISVSVSIFSFSENV